MTFGSSLKYLNEHHIQPILHRSRTSSSLDEDSDDGSSDNFSMRHIHQDLDHCPMGDDVAFASNWYFNVLLDRKSGATVADWPTVKCKFTNPDYALDTNPNGHRTPCADNHPECCYEELGPNETCSCPGPCAQLSRSNKSALSRSDSGKTCTSGSRSVVSFATSNDLTTADDGLRCSFSTPSQKCKDLTCWCHKCEPMPKGRLTYFRKVKCRSLICEYFGPEHAKIKGASAGPEKVECVKIQCKRVER